MQHEAVYGIDPGTEKTGWVLWNGTQVIDSGITPNVEMLEKLRRHGTTPKPIPMYIEMIACYGMAVGKETFETCVWIGRFVEVWSILEFPWHLCYRTQIKLHHCHSARAKDANVSQALRDKYGQVGTKKSPGPLFGVKEHIWSALAIATYAKESNLECLSKVVDEVQVAAAKEAKVQAKAAKKIKNAAKAAAALQTGSHRPL